MSDGYNLVYYHRETKKKYLAKRVAPGNYILLDPETGAKLPISGTPLARMFDADEKNSKNQRKVRLDFRKRKRVDSTEERT